MSRTPDEARQRGEPLDWRERLRAGLPPLPIAGATNVTWGYTVSDTAHLQARATLTTGTPTKEGIDMHSGGYGAQLSHWQWMLLSVLPSGLEKYNLNWETVYWEIRLVNDERGDFDARRLADGTFVMQRHAPAYWWHPWENLVSEVEAAAVGAPIFDGNILRGQVAQGVVVR